MTEEFLKTLPLDTLFDMMVNGTNELLEAVNKKNDIVAKIKQSEVELIQRVIVAKGQKTQKVYKSPQFQFIAPLFLK